MTDVLVLGAGLSGLVAAWRLSQLGQDVRIVDALDEPGGTMRTVQRDGCVFEVGAHSFANNRERTRWLLAELDLDEEVIEASASAKTRYLYRHGRLRAVPSNPVALLRTDLLSAPGRLRLLAEPFWLAPEPADDATLAELLDARIGHEARTVLADSVVGGIYAGSTETLGADDAFPTLARGVRTYGSVLMGMLAAGRGPARGSLCTLRHGMGSLTSTLAQRLPSGALQVATRATSARRTESGWRVELQREGQRETVEAQRLVCAMPSHAAAPLLAEVLPRPVTDAMRRVHYAPVAVAGLGIPVEQVRNAPASFGFLVPRGEGLRILGGIFTSAIFDHRAAPGLATFAVFVGGVHHPEDVERDDDELNRMVDRELATALGVDALKPTVRFTYRWPRAIPQYGPGHLARVARIEQAARDVGQLHWLGNWRGGVSLHDCIERGLETAENLVS